MIDEDRTAEGDKVVFYASLWGNRYQVQFQVLYEYRWEDGERFERKSSAIYAAEMLMKTNGIERVRVVDRET